MSNKEISKELEKEYQDIRLEDAAAYRIKINHQKELVTQAEHDAKIAVKEMGKWAERADHLQAENQRLRVACESALWSGAIRFADSALDKEIKRKLEEALKRTVKP